MIHILTVHWNDDKWIDIQLSHFKKHIHSHYKVYAFLNNIPVSNFEKFSHVETENIKEHYIKLNILADLAILNSKNENDILIFIDGDAFPIKDIDYFLINILNKYPIAAIQRIENLGDIQPHPSFCVTTVKFWMQIDGNWGLDNPWINENNKIIYDVGGSLLKKLNEKQVNWYPLRRSNKKNIHPLFFGIYDNLIYHHGAGFRLPVSRIDIQKSFVAKFYFKTKKMFPKFLSKKIQLEKYIFKKNIKLDKLCYENIKFNSNFIKELL